VSPTGNGEASPTGPKPSQQVRSEPACIPAMGCSVPGVARVQAAWLSPEICIVVVEKDKFPRPRGRKADALECAEGSSPGSRNGE